MAEESLGKKTIKNSIWNFASSLIGRVGGFVLTIILARVLMPERFGIFTLALSIAAIFMIFADMQINSTMLRYVSSEIKKNKKKAAGYFKYMFKVKLSLVIIVSLLLILLAYPISVYMFGKSEIFPLLILFSGFVFISTIQGFFENIFFLNQEVKYVFVKENILQFGKIGLTLLVIAVLSSSYYLMGIIVGFILSSVITLGFCLFYFYKKSFFLIKESEKINKVRIWKYLGVVAFWSFSAIFFSYVDIIMLGLFVQAAYIGYYKVVFATVAGVAGFMTITNVLMPIFTQMKTDRLEEIGNKILKYMLAIAVPASFGLMILANYIIKVFYGSVYLPATLPMRILSFLIIPIIFTNVIGTILSAKEKPKAIAKLVVVVTIINLILNYILISSLLRISEIWATAGAAIATLTSWIIYMVVAIPIAKKEAQVNIEIRNIIKPLIASLIMGVYLIYILSFLRDVSIGSGIFIIASGFVVYVISFVVIKGISIKEIRYLLSSLRLKKR